MVLNSFCCCSYRPSQSSSQDFGPKKNPKRYQHGLESYLLILENQIKSRPTWFKHMPYIPYSNGRVGKKIKSISSFTYKNTFSGFFVDALVKSMYYDNLISVVTSSEMWGRVLFNKRGYKKQSEVILPWFSDRNWGSTYFILSWRWKSSKKRQETKVRPYLSFAQRKRIICRYNMVKIIDHPPCGFCFSHYF